MMLDLSGVKQWRPPVVRTSTLDGSGIKEMFAAIERHRLFLEESGQLQKVREVRVRRDVLDLIEDKIKNTVWEQVSGSENFELMVSQIMSRETDPYSAANQLLGSISLGCRKMF